MDNSMQRGSKMLGKLYGSNRSQQSEWRFGDTRMLDDSRSFKDSQIQGPSRQHGDFHMQDSRLHLESRMEPNHSPPRMSDASEMQGNSRIPERVRGGSHLSREVRTHQEPRIQAGNRLQGSSRIYEDMPVQDQLKSRSNAIAYDYNHRRSDEISSFKDIGVPSNFAANSHENVRSGRGGYHIQGDDCARQGFSDVLPGLPNENSGKRDLGLLSPKSYGQVSGIPPGSSHILTPSLTSSGPQTGDGVRPIGNRGSCPKKSSKAFDYLKTWRLKMNMPTDAFLLEKEGMVGNNQQSHDNVSHTHDDWYTQPPAAEPRVGRASIDPEWNYLGNSFSEKDTYGERPNSKYGDTRTNSYGELVGVCPRGQSLENDRTINPPWRWDEEVASGQNQGAKRNYESMASGQSFNSGHGDGRQQQRDVMQPKRQRLSPSIMQSDRREAVEQYASVISEQENLLQSNATGTDDGRLKINVSSGFYESQGDWKTSPFHSRPQADPSKFSRSHDSSGESVGSRHKLLPGEMKGMMARERLQTSYTHSRDVRNVSHNHPNSERSPEHLGRDRYSQPHPQERASRLVGRGQSQELHRGSMDQGRPPPPSEMFMSAAPYAQEMSQRSYPRARSHRSPAKVKSPGIGARERSPALFSRRKSPAAMPREKCSEPSARDRSSPWRKGRSPRPGRGRSPGPMGGRSSGPARMALQTGRGSSPGSVGRGRLSAPAGRHRSPGTEGLSGLIRRERSPEHTGRVKSPGSGRGRSPGPPRRGRSPRHQVRERSPGSTRRERSPGLPGRGRSLDHGRWKSPGRSPDHSGRGKSPEPFRKERLLGSSGRGKSPALSGKGRSPVVPSGRGRSPGPGGQSSGHLRRGKSPAKSHAGRRGSPGSFEQGKLPSRRSPESSGRGKSPGPGRGRTSGHSGRSPGAAGSDRSLRPSGKGKQTGAPGRERSPKLLVTGKPLKTVKGESPGLVPHRSAEHQGQPRSRSPATGVGSRRRSVKGEQARSPSHLSRGRSPMKEKSPVGTRMRTESFPQGKQRPIMERAPRLRSRSPQPPVKRLVAGDRGKNETLLTRECRDYRIEGRERSPYLEEVSLSPRSNRFWSPSGRAVMNIRSRHRERSQSVGALERGCSPVSVQSGDYPAVRSTYPQEPFFPERERDLQQDHSPQFYHGCSPLSVDGCSPARKKSLEVEVGSCGRQRGRFYSPSREVSFSTGKQSVEKIHGTAGNWREHDKDRGTRHFSGKKGAPVKTSDAKDATSTVGSKFVDKPEGTLLEEEVDDEDLRIHLLRLREQKVEMKLMKLEEESKETELKLWELTKNKTSPRGESPLEEEQRYTEKEPYRTFGRRQESYSWKYQHSSAPADRGRYHKPHKRY